MKTASALLISFLFSLAWLSGPCTLAGELPGMKFNEVKEVAPGVFFRYSSISATDLTIPFGGSNNIWIIFDEFVVVVDANFPKEAGDVVKAIRKTTDKPIRYVLDTHHHGDHAYGNTVWVKEGATIVGQTNCQRLMATRGPAEWEKAGKGPMGRKDIAENVLKVPTLVFDDRLVLDDGKQRVEFLYFGHGHTAGDAVAYLPRHKILCTGDACVNGAFNFMGHSDSASWIRILERMEKLDVDMICPGHGAVAGKELLAKQKRYFQELRRRVKEGIDERKTLEDVTKTIDMPWYKDWTGKEARTNGDNIAHVYGELTGKIMPADLGSLPVGKNSYCMETPGWVKPRRIVIPNLSPALLSELKIVAPEIEFISARTAAEAAKYAADADGVVGFASPEVLRAGKKLRWVQSQKANPDASGKPDSSELTVTLSPADLTNGDQRWQLWRENVRRFAAGERLLCAAE